MVMGKRCTHSGDPARRELNSWARTTIPEQMKVNRDLGLTCRDRILVAFGAIL